MIILSRRSVLRSSLAAAAAGMLARPYLANAAATTATVWWVQGFAEEEDISFKKIVADYAKASGNTIDYSIIPYAPERQKIVSAMTSGVVPDLFQNNPAEIIALYAWEDKLVDVTDVVETQKSLYNETGLLTAYCYNNAEKRRSFYGVPYTSAVRPNHIWRPLVEKAGYTMEDLPRTWDAFYDFFKEVQKKLRAQGERKVYALGFQMNTTGNDCNALFDYFLIAHGGQDIVTKDGRLHLDDPKVREALLKTLTYPTTAYKEGFVPPGAINWNDADDNNAFHAKQIVMDLDGTISTEVAVIHKEQDYRDIVTMGLPLSNDGKPVPSQAPSVGGQRLSQIFDPAAGAERVSENRSRPQYSVYAFDRAGRPLVARGPAPSCVRPAGRARPDPAELLDLQSGLCPGPERTCLAHRLGGYHDRRDDA
jgi:multiple sugar transport system substrate-binding protein